MRLQKEELQQMATQVWKSTPREKIKQPETEQLCVYKTFANMEDYLWDSDPGHAISNDEKQWKSVCNYKILHSYNFYLRKYLN